MFRTVASAVLDRRQLAFRYRARSTDAESARRISPQRLTHYRENWYLDAWDHDRAACAASRSTASPRRSCSTGAPGRARGRARRASLGQLRHLLRRAKAWATVVFSARAARWVADEHWHSRQEGRFLPDGRYELKVPYSNSRELLMDVLRYGPDAEILSPAPLREEAKIR